MLGRFIKLYLLLNRRVWLGLPDSLKNCRAGRAYGRHLHALVCRYSKRNQNHSTFFLRNRPELELICSLLTAKPFGASVAIAVLGCSKGAEVYSILWAIRKARPDLRVRLQAVDISPEIVDFAEDGVYSLKDPVSLNSPVCVGTTEDEELMLATCRDQGPNGSVSIFERLTESEMNSMFDREGDQAKIKSWIKEGFSVRDGGEGIIWRVGDASSAEITRVLGPQDITVANRFLCHMEPTAALKCLRNINAMVKPGGYIFVSGVDLDIRTKVAKEMSWKPVSESRREIYEGDSSLVEGWPLAWWSVEPFCESHPDWEIRYASVFRVSATSLTKLDHAPATLSTLVVS